VLVRLVAALAVELARPLVEVPVPLVVVLAAVQVLLVLARLVAALAVEVAEVVSPQQVALVAGFRLLDFVGHLVAVRHLD